MVLGRRMDRKVSLDHRYSSGKCIPILALVYCYILGVMSRMGRMSMWYIDYIIQIELESCEGWKFLGVCLARKDFFYFVTSSHRLYSCKKSKKFLAFERKIASHYFYHHHYHLQSFKKIFMSILYSFFG